MDVINIGITADDGSGDPLRTAFDKVNGNFAELLAAISGELGATVTLNFDEMIQILANMPDVVSDYASLNAAVAAIGSTTVTLQYGADATLTGNIVIPANIELLPINGAKIIHGAYTVSYAGSTARWPMAQIFSGTGAVTLSPLATAVPQWFGAKGDDSTNDSAAFRAAVASCNRVYVPPGIYRVGVIKLKSYSEFFGAGSSSILRRAEGVDEAGQAVQPYLEYIVLLATYYGSEGTADIANNKTDIYVHDLYLDGRSRDFTPDASSYHDMSIQSTSNLTIERVTFYDFIGDGLYIGSGNSAEYERHNTNIKVVDCVFDGCDNGNRSGISVIDCDGLTVKDSLFKRIGNDDLAQSVGGVNFEPNADHNINRNALIFNCAFEDISTTNTAAVSVYNPHQIGLNMHNWKVEQCTFLRCYAGFSGSARRKLPDGYDDNISIKSCTFINSLTFDIVNLGFKGFSIIGNTFRLDPIASASYRGAIKLGQLSGGINSAAYDTLISDNKFIGLRPQFGMIALYGANSLIISRNVFEEITGIIVKFLSPAEAGTQRYLKNINIVSNTVNNQMRHTGTVTTSSFIGSTGGINTDDDNSLINSSCIERDNIMNHGVPKFGGGVRAIFREQQIAAAPTSGTWAVGDKLYFTVPSAGSVGTVASVAGTFGTLAGATANATNGSAVLAGIVDPNDSLRSGQYITIAGDAVKKQILAIDGTTVYLSGNYTGTTGTGCALAWFAPTFVTF